MRADVHVAALKAAAKVAFSVALLNGCGGAVETPSTGASEDGNDPVSTNEPEVKSSPHRAHAYGKHTPDVQAPQAPAPESKPSKPADPVSCDATLAATFPTPGGYQWNPVAHSKEVVACCDAELSKIDTEGSTAYRWDCCVAYDEADPDKTTVGHTEGHAMACTPWGPPVPPSMKRTRRPSEEIAAWILKAVA